MQTLSQRDIRKQWTQWQAALETDEDGLAVFTSHRAPYALCRYWPTLSPEQQEQAKEYPSYPRSDLWHRGTAVLSEGPCVIHADTIKRPWALLTPYHLDLAALATQSISHAAP